MKEKIRTVSPTSSTHITLTTAFALGSLKCDHRSVFPTNSGSEETFIDAFWDSFGVRDWRRVSRAVVSGVIVLLFG